MKYFKTIENGFIVALTTEHGVNEISEAEYSNILDIIRHYPKNAPQGKMYLLRADNLEWELVEVPPDPDPGDEDATEQDYQNALNQMGVNFDENA